MLSAVPRTWVVRSSFVCLIVAGIAASGCGRAGPPEGESEPPSAAAVSAASALYRINAGGPAYTDPSGAVWQADAHFNTGSTFSVGTPVGNTTMSLLYQYQRWDAAAAPELRYSLPVANGQYLV